MFRGMPSGIRFRTVLAFPFLALAVMTFAVSPALAKQKKRADLVVKSVSASSPANRQVDVEATTANRGKKKSKGSKTEVFLSSDASQDAADTSLGSLDVPGLKSKKSDTASGSFTAPSSVQVGSYTVIACADGGERIKEKSEKNQCHEASGKITVTADGGTTPPPPATVSVSATAGPGGTVATSGIGGGSCAANACTLTPGASAVTFTPAGSGINTFNSWTGASCTGYTTGPGNAITFTNPTAEKACTATFNEFFTISWTNFNSWATVSGCGQANSVATSGSCAVAKGSTTTIVTAPNGGSFTYDPANAWGGATCNGTATQAGSGASETHTMTFTNVTSNHACAVQYKIGP